MTHQETIDRAAKADALLKSPMFEEAFNEVRLSIISGMENLAFEDREQGDQLRMCLKLLRVVRAKVEQAVRDGKVAAFRLDEEQRLNKDRENG